MSTPASFPLLGGRVNALSVPDLHEVIDSAISAGRKIVIASQNLHGIYVAHRDAGMREFYARADYVRIDGMPIVLWGRVLGYPLEREHRVTWVDWLRPLMTEAVERGWRLFYLGSKPGVAEQAAEILRHELPGLQLGTSHGYFDPAPGGRDSRQILEEINRFRPDILMVGMGMPRQERWILDHLNDLDVGVVLPCGACLDYVAGVIPTPPRWMGRVGLEWLYRLTTEPRRLWKRYLVEPWFIAGLLVRDAVSLARGRIPRPTARDNRLSNRSGGW